MTLRANYSLQFFVQFLVFLAFTVISLHPLFPTQIHTNVAVLAEPYEIAISVSQNGQKLAISGFNNAFLRQAYKYRKNNIHVYKGPKLKKKNFIGV